LKAGGAYVPLDPRYPAERLSYMLQDSEPTLVLLHERTREALGETLTAPSLDLRADAQRWRGYSAANPRAAAVGLRANHLAYVIYTSGSTGQPKGVMNEHRGMVNRIAAQQAFEGFTARDICCHKTSISHVDAVFEVFGPLCSGSRLVIIREARDPGQIAAVVAREQVTRLLTVPSLARYLLAEPAMMRQLGKLRAWTLSGEEVGAELLMALQEQLPGCEFIMQYGSSEVSSDAALYKSRRFGADRVPIGSPLPNVQMHILDRHGALGDIWVGGVGVARGYLNKPELTAERFVRDPFARDPQARLYRMGDIGRWRPDGLLECLGRQDRQVKIRGFRVELGEVEAALRKQPDVAEAVVLALESELGEKRLVAYVTIQDGGELHAGWLREQLLMSLPDYMVPAAYVRLEALPLTANGKLDRRALPAPESGAYVTGEYEPPQTEVEEALAAIWQEVLKVERVGRGDNFFALGGHSLLATRVMTRVRAVLGLELPLLAIFEAASLSDLAARTEQLMRQETACV
jgi:amino acid adenylation domain-containing protein